MKMQMAEEMAAEYQNKFLVLSDSLLTNDISVTELCKFEDKLMAMDSLADLWFTINDKISKQREN